MSTPIKDLQTSLAKDLVKLEDLNVSEEHLEMIEHVYQTIYDSIINVDQEKD
jgi:sulfur relay (sulfurtransferase) DsrC/TusE family protein